MLNHIHASNLRLSTTLRGHVARRLDYALSAFRDHVQAVKTRLLDLNGPRGGEDKLCVVTIEARGLEPIRARAVDRDVYVAVDLATSAAGRQLGRALDRRRSRRLLTERRAKRRGA